MSNPRKIQLTVRARAVDLLGRQQIAGIPTAIHELFKNAYDAFAQQVQVDLIRSQRAFVLRDDGYGMTRDDFETKWLSVGTESKLGDRTQQAAWLGTYGQSPRILLGEKGIGRLAIAAIGPAVLIITRANRPAGLDETVVSMVHWKLFEIPGLDLSAIEIPVITVAGGTLPSEVDIKTLSMEILANIDSIGPLIPQKDRLKIKKDLELLIYPPMQFEAKYPGPSLQGDGFGTHFIVRPYDELLDSIIDDTNDESASTLEKMLLGFGNTILPGQPPPPLTASFKDHALDGTTRDIVGDQSFFSPEEFSEADHQITGQFDESGQFSGSVRIYNQAPISYTLPWPSSGQPTDCGPFSISFGYVQGLSHESLLDQEEWYRLTTKLNRIGGLYIYRDGIRILPYGDSDYDFLNIERRRTKAAKDWVFSYRRIYGAVVLNSKSNGNLQEKAGREGFRENHAYRQFKQLLEGLFMQVAKDFFRESSQYDDGFRRILDDLQERNRLLKKSEELQKTKKLRFQQTLDNFFKVSEKGDFTARFKKVADALQGRVEGICVIKDPEEQAKQISRVQLDGAKIIEQFRREIQITKPRGVGLTKSLVADWEAYRRLSEDLNKVVLKSFENDFSISLQKILHQNSGLFKVRTYVKESLETRRKTWIQKAVSEQHDAKISLENSTRTVRDEISRRARQLREGIDVVITDFERTELTNRSVEEITQFQEALIRRVDIVSEPEVAVISQIKAQLDDLISASESGIFGTDVRAALEERSDALQNEVNDYLEWAQVGMAVGIVQHEFDSTVKGVKKEIQRLKPWADGTPQLRDLFNGLRTGFNHLENYLSLFTPLERRLYRKKSLLIGNEISAYLRSVFGERCARHDISISGTPEFSKASFEVFPSTILPALVNLVDNACFWLSNSQNKDKVIELGLSNMGISVRNNGPAINERSVSRIFELGYSLKPNGRGMGLYIVKRTLQRDGWTIELVSNSAANGPKFVISPENHESKSV